ncbi:kinesin family member 4/21/27 [Geosmithia morbida]|uniref:Kinesin family member 4/21/27 n=2 Tax=Geosmithia morbida TaxID=1094350 RepID=A0A9P4YN12_9HYPO|nr:kinesin family member 4/21/27 [Geosmithia morbida]KAF4119580.1 kinesin family member 4/21/27 [Geosmithia morbida]
MASSPPVSPSPYQRPASAIARPANRTSSRLSMNGSRIVTGGSRASDEDSRTAVKVAVRVRPPLKSTDPGYELIPQRFQRSMVQTTSNTSLAIDSPQGRKLFVFDRVFGSDVTQEGIWDYLSDSVQAFTQGYNVSLLAYGQSGAGKSYTMGTSGPGEQHDEDIMGVIPRAARALFEVLEVPTVTSPNKTSNRNSLSQLKTPRAFNQHTMLGDRNWSLKATYVEIYNEHLRDLLVAESTPVGERGAVAIREDTKGNIILTGLQQVEINSVEDLMGALNFGSAIRQTDATAINAKSSRSHAVFSLNLVRRRKTSTAEKRFSVPLETLSGSDVPSTTDSKLHFVDLAGSERLKNTGAHGDRAKEGISINAGLASLGKVISQLSSRQPGSHVSYRDSKLTRLLQDSLGGNAITYMIACVTPAEFHLSETLNTVQYAQRARAIQSKPRIQEVEEGDKQAVIDRLKAEVAFLREQVSNSNSNRQPSPRRGAAGPADKPDRHSERESELQNQLLDAQENYTALGQRHAKLIAELAKARENELAAENAQADDAGDSATDRLNRSNSFAQAVEQVVLEYEKTIQSLEQSLSSTRSILSNTEASLLEKETRCAYAETISNQLQARLQKVMDREASTENYLHDLEAKLDGHTSGEEKNATIIMELRKEISRIRENESSCEEYISTLEERLAEADQDSELMQREIDRLEQVVERQRSLGKLDTLLHELDEVKEARQPEPDTREAAINGTGRRRGGSTAGHSRAQSHVSRHSQIEEPIPEGDEDADFPNDAEPKITTVKEEESEERRGESLVSETAKLNRRDSAQSRFVYDKLENVTQELIDLRVDHEATVNQYDLLHSKYEEAMAKVAELQDAIDESRHMKHNVRDSVLSDAAPAERPESFLSEMQEGDSKFGVRSSVSRSLSSELSSAMDSPATVDTSNCDVTSEDETATTKPGASTEDLSRAPASATLGDSDTTTGADNMWIHSELQRLKAAAEAKDVAEKELASKYAELELRHNATLDMVEELKTEVSKAKANEASSPRTANPVIRRKSSQNLLIDRAHRSFASLRNIANDNFGDEPEVMRNFEININAAMHELHSRSERIQELEADMASAKKEMETKMTIISGLTRERSSLKASPMDMSMVASLQDRLEQSERRLDSMREAHEAPKAKVTASDLNADKDQATRDADEKQHNLINFLRNEVDEYKAIINSNATKVAELERVYSSTKAQLDDVAKSHSATMAELENVNKALDTATQESSARRELVSKLEDQMASLEQEAKTHHESMDALKTAHALELAELRTREQKGYEEQVEVLMGEHADAIQKLEEELAGSREQLLTVATTVANALGIEASTDKLNERIDALAADQKALAAERKKTGEMESHVAELSTINETLMNDLEATKKALSDMVPDGGNSLADQLSAVKTKISDLDSFNKKNSRLVEELEDQLQNNFDEAQMTNNRLSSLQSERNSQIEEASTTRMRMQAELETIREEYASLQARYIEVSGSDVTRSNSNSTVRKSASHTSLPSPPPAIPLPPLPNGSSSPPPPVNGVPSSPTSSMRPLSKDNINISQITEDQEARIRTIEKHLYAERQLTQTLEEALTDLEKQSNKVKADCDAWRKKALSLENEMKELRSQSSPEPRQDNRWSLQAVEEERKKRQAAEAARKQLEERMNAINKGKKKKGSLNCF